MHESIKGEILLAADNPHIPDWLCDDREVAQIQGLAGAIAHFDFLQQNGDDLASATSFSDRPTTVCDSVFVDRMRLTNVLANHGDSINPDNVVTYGPVPLDECIKALVMSLRQCESKLVDKITSRG